MNSLSPFLPGTQIQYAWDSTSLGWLKTCPQLYYLHMIEGWTPKGERIHLKFGQLYHSGLELYDKLRAADPELQHNDAVYDVVKFILEETWEGSGYGKPWVTDHPSKNRETLVRSIIWYLDHFNNDPAQTITLANGKPAVELSFKFELDQGPGTQLTLNSKPNQPYILCGHLDRVVNYIDGNYVADRKTTTSALASSYFDQYSPDNQMSLYSYAARIVYKAPVKGVIIDAAQIMVGFTRFARGFTHRTDAQLDEWLVETISWFRLAEHYATEKSWPKNDKACHQYGGCTFRKVCSKDPSVRQKFLESDFEKREWNPLVPR